MAWQGRLLRVDLTAGTCTEEALNMEWAQTYRSRRLSGQQGPCHQVPGGGDGPEGGSALAREQADLRDRPADRDHGADRRPLHGRHQGCADQRRRLLELGRLLRRRVEARGLGHGDLRGPLAAPRLSLYQGRPRRTDRRRRLRLGQVGLGYRAGDQGAPPGRRDQDRLDRPCRREPQPLRLRDERPRPGRRALRRRRRDGVQEPRRSPCAARGASRWTTATPSPRP